MRKRRHRQISRPWIFSNIFQPQPQPQPQPPRLIGQPSVASVVLSEQSVASISGTASAHVPHMPNRFRTAALAVMASNRIRAGAQREGGREQSVASFSGVLPYASSVTAASIASGVSSPGRECVLCLSAPRTKRLEPCGHGCLCQECLKRLSENGSAKRRHLYLQSEPCRWDRMGHRFR